MTSRVGDVFAGLYGGITGVSKTVNDGLNGFETELNYTRAGSGLLKSIANFPSTLKTVANVEALEAFQLLSAAVAPVAETLDGLKVALNFFELPVRVSKLGTMPSLSVWKGLSLIFQIVQKATESIFLEPTGKKWGWYTLESVGRFTYIQASRFTLSITKDVCVFASATFSMLGTAQETKRTEATLARKKASLVALKALNVRKEEGARTPKKAETKAPATPEAKPAPTRQGVTEATLHSKQAIQADLNKILTSENLGEKSALYFEYLEKTRTAPTVKSATGWFQPWYNQAMAWFQNVGYNVESRSIEAQKLQRFTTPQEQQAEAKRINAFVAPKLDAVTADLNKAFAKSARQSVWYSAASRYNGQREQLKQYKIRKKEAQIANLESEMLKHSWANWFDITKLTISTLGALMTIRAEALPTRWIVQQLHSGYSKEILIGGMFLNALAMSILGFGRTRHLAQKPKALPPAPLMPKVA